MAKPEEPIKKRNPPRLGDGKRKNRDSRKAARRAGAEARAALKETDGKPSDLG